MRGITINHETAFPTGWLMAFAQGASSNVKVTNSIFTEGWGVGFRLLSLQAKPF